MKEIRKIYDEKTQWSVEELPGNALCVRLKKNGLYLEGYGQLDIQKIEINAIIEMLQQFRSERLNQPNQ